MPAIEVPAIAVLDVGGTAIKTGVVTGVPGSVEVGPAIPALALEPADVVLGQWAAAAQGALDLAGPTAIGLAVAVPGPFDLDTGTPLMQGLGKFDSIYGVELGPELRARTTIGDRPIVFVRDNEAAGVGEATAGAGVGVPRVFTITLGTGVGTALTDGGIPILVVGDLTVARLAMDRITPWGRADDVLSARGLAARLGVATGELEALVATGTVDADLAEHGHRIGVFLAPIMGELDAELVVVGGGLAAAFDRFGPAIQHELDTVRPRDVRCVPATLGTAGPLLGAAHLAFPHPGRSTRNLERT